MTTTPTHSFMAAALHYGSLGWRVIPIVPGEKYPSKKEWTEFATTDRALIVTWWSATPDHGVGVVTGLVSGLFVLDVDVSEGKHGDESLADLEATYGKLPDTPTVLTGSGGAHYYFKMPSGVVITNDAGKRLGPGLDVRGEGGQVLAPPTIHPNGRAYEWDAMSNPETLAVAAAPPWLVTLLTVTPSVTGASRERPQRTGDDMLPGDVFACEHDWPSLLLADGASYLGTRRDAKSGTSYELWARPGADHVSASLYFGGQDVLKVFSTSWDGLTAEKTYTRFGYFAATKHGGDHVAAARALTQAKLKAGNDEWAAQVAGANKGEKRNSNNKGENEDQEEYEQWEDPLPLSEYVELPSFPLDVLPTWLSSYTRALSTSTQTPVDLACCLALAALAAAAGGRAVVEVNDGWKEPVNLFVAVAMAPGTRKSAVFQAVSKPLFEAQRDNAESMRIELIEAKSARKAAAKAREIAESDWAKASDSDKDAASDRLKAAAFLAESITLPTTPRLLADDATPEALGSLMAEQQGRIAVMSAEGDVFDLMAGRYSGAPNLGIYLKGHAGDPYVLDRKGREPEHIEHPALTIGLAVQPDVLRAIADRPGFRGRGLLARFLYSLPASTVGERLIDVADIPGPTKLRYEHNLKTLTASLSEWVEPMVLTLTADAREALRVFRAALEPRLRPHGDLSNIVEWASKLAGAVVRISGLLHLAENVVTGYRVPIERGTIDSAIAIADYFVPHAQATFRMMSPRAGLFADAEAVLSRVRREGWAQFHQRQLQRAMMSRFPLVDDLLPVMSLLVEYGYLRPVVFAVGNARRAKVFDVHPALIAE